MRKTIALATSVTRRKLRKPFCASLARGRFYTAWTHSGYSHLSNHAERPHHLVARHSDFDRLVWGQGSSGKYLGSTSTSMLRGVLGCLLMNPPRALNHLRAPSSTLRGFMSAIIKNNYMRISHILRSNKHWHHDA